jgi:hypothetical protein
MPVHPEEEDEVEQVREKGRSTYLGGADNRRGHGGTRQDTEAPSQARPGHDERHSAHHDTTRHCTAPGQAWSTCRCAAMEVTVTLGAAGVEEKQEVTNPSDRCG